MFERPVQKKDVRQEPERKLDRAYLTAVLLASSVLVTVPAYSQDTVTSRIGLRDPISIGLSFGSPTAICVNVKVIPARAFRFAIGGYYGAGIAKWGISEGHGITAQLDLALADDKINNALVISPELEYCTLVGVTPPSRGWINFSPYETVNSIGIDCGAGWVHEYRTWSLELALTPGAAYALGGRDSGDNSAQGEVSFQMRLLAAARF